MWIRWIRIRNTAQQCTFVFRHRPYTGKQCSVVLGYRSETGIYPLPCNVKFCKDIDQRQVIIGQLTVFCAVTKYICMRGIYYLSSMPAVYFGVWI
jgi:hypothetical protein